MDKNIMDFWGNLFINAAKGQKQLDEMTEWSRKAMSRFVDWSASFQKLYSLEALTPVSPPQFKEWNKLGDEMQKSVMDRFFKMWGLKNGPDEHLQLIRRYEELKERIAFQEETIRHLRLLLDEARRENLSLMASRHRESNVEPENQWSKSAPGFSA